MLMGVASTVKGDNAACMRDGPIVMTSGDLPKYRQPVPCAASLPTDDDEQNVAVLKGAHAAANKLFNTNGCAAWSRGSLVSEDPGLYGPQYSQ